MSVFEGLEPCFTHAFQVTRHFFRNCIKGRHIYRVIFEMVLTCVIRKAKGRASLIPFMKFLDAFCHLRFTNSIINFKYGVIESRQFVP